MLHNYLTAVSGFSLDIVTDAVDLVIRGYLPGHDGRFAPTPPMLATACRLVAEQQARQRYLAGLNAPRLAPPEIVKTDEQRRRVLDIVAHAAEAIGAVDAETDEAAIAASKARWARVNARFMPEQTEDAIRERLLGYSIGSPESEREAS